MISLKSPKKYLQALLLFTGARRFGIDSPQKSHAYLAVWDGIVRQRIVKLPKRATAAQEN
jgi:hypothetical protein